MSLRVRIQDKYRRARERMRADARKGSAAIEFALVGPVLFLMLFGMIECGVIFFGSSALENSTDDAGRLVRTGQASNWTVAQFKTQICSEMSGLIDTTTCTNNLLVDVREFSDFSGASYPSVTNPDGSINTSDLSYPTSFTACQVVLIRAFYPWSIMTPLMQPLLQNMPNGRYLMSAATAFRSEPFTAGSSC
jgi:Flp pilus assembly protein TadG